LGATSFLLFCLFLVIWQREAGNSGAAHDVAAGQSAGRETGNRPEGELSGTKSQAEIDAARLELMQDRENQKHAVAASPIGEVRKKLVGAWRWESMMAEGQWTKSKKMGMSRDIEFRADGTARHHFHTIGDREGCYELSAGDGCVDVLATFSSSPSSEKYTYAFSVAFENGKLLMTPMQMGSLRSRLFKSIKDGRKESALSRYYRVAEFRVEE
jgi:hypothetical protein